MNKELDFYFVQKHNCSLDLLECAAASMIRLAGYVLHIVRELNFPGDFLTKRGFKLLESLTSCTRKIEHFSSECL